MIAPLRNKGTLPYTHAYILEVKQNCPNLWSYVLPQELEHRYGGHLKNQFKALKVETKTDRKVVVTL